MTAFPEPYVVLHIARDYSGSTDSHGNKTLVAQVGVIRRVIEIVVTRSETVQSGEHQSRQVTELAMAVGDPTVYRAGDQIVVGGDEVSGDYVGGEAFVVDGRPSDDRTGPWPKYSRLTGGVVRLVRVA